MREIAAVALLLSTSSVSAAPVWDDYVAAGPSYHLYFPSLKAVPIRSTLGRFTAIRVTVRCGYITGISRVPPDWWVELRGPISGVTTLEASAGHGATYLSRLDTWSGSIAITVNDVSCFDVTAGVVTEPEDNEKPTERLFTRSQLELRQ